MKLDWQYESEECPYTQIAVTGDSTILRLTFNPESGEWRCQALYKRTPKCKNVSVVASLPGLSPDEAVKKVIAVLKSLSITPRYNTKALMFTSIV